MGISRVYEGFVWSIYRPWERAIFAKCAEGRGTTKPPINKLLTPIVLRTSQILHISQGTWDQTNDVQLSHEANFA